MPVPSDHAIANRVRTILYRRWIDTRNLDFGSVNGVVYVRGELCRNPMLPASRLSEESELALLHVLERDLRAIPDVKDVQIDLKGFQRGETHWEQMPARTA